MKQKLHLSLQGFHHWGSSNFYKRITNKYPQIPQLVNYAVFCFKNKQNIFLLTSKNIGTKSLCNLRTEALLFVSMQKVTQFSVNERTSGTLFFTATFTSVIKTSYIQINDSSTLKTSNITWLVTIWSSIVNIHNRYQENKQIWVTNFIMKTYR